MSKRPHNDESCIDNSAVAPHANRRNHTDASHSALAEDKAGPSHVQRTSQRVASRERKHPVLMYRDTEGLARICEGYKAGSSDKYVEIVIQPQYMSKDNQRAKDRQLWGDEVYTPDSDIVAILMHMGYYSSRLDHPPANIQEFRVLLELLPPQDRYPAKVRFSRSRAWYSYVEGCSLKVERCWVVTQAGTTHDLSPCVDYVRPATLRPDSGPEPEMHLDKTTKKVTSSGSYRTLPVMYNLCQEPWLKYSLAEVADKGLDPSEWTIARMREEVLFVETLSERFQIAYVSTTNEGASSSKDLFSFSRCTPLPTEVMRRDGLPLAEKWCRVIHAGLAWEEFKWGATLSVQGVEYRILRVHFMPMRYTPPQHPVHGPYNNWDVLDKYLQHHENPTYEEVAPSVYRKLLYSELAQHSEATEHMSKKELLRCWL